MWDWPSAPALQSYTLKTHFYCSAIILFWDSISCISVWAQTHYVREARLLPLPPKGWDGSPAPMHQPMHKAPGLFLYSYRKHTTWEWPTEPSDYEHRSGWGSSVFPCVILPANSGTVQVPLRDRQEWGNVVTCFSVSLGCAKLLSSSTAPSSSAPVPCTYYAQTLSEITPLSGKTAEFPYPHNKWTGAVTLLPGFQYIQVEDWKASPAWTTLGYMHSKANTPQILVRISYLPYYASA